MITVRTLIRVKSLVGLTVGVAGLGVVFVNADKLLKEEHQRNI